MLTINVIILNRSLIRVTEAVFKCGLNINLVWKVAAAMSISLFSGAVKKKKKKRKMFAYTRTYFDFCYFNGALKGLLMSIFTALSDKRNQKVYDHVCPPLLDSTFLP